MAIPTGRKIVVFVLMSLLIMNFAFTIHSQENQASLLLDLKEARAKYEIARQNLEKDKRLFENNAISEEQYNQSKNELLSREVAYQKLILRVISQQSYIIVEKAVKYQNLSGERRVKVTLRSTMEGNQEYLSQFEEHFDVFTPEMRSNKIYNIFVSLIDLENKTIIGAPYEIRVPVLELGKTVDADFGLLRDVESLQVGLNYGGRKDEKNIYLEKDASANIVDIVSTQFSQEADLGSSAVFDLTLERFSSTDDVYTLEVLNLPRQVSYEFTDAETNARLSQIKFTQGVNIKRLSLRAYLPDRDDDNIVIDRPLVFYALVLSREEREKLGGLESKQFTDADLAAIQGGKVKLELVPRGVGRIEVRAPSLYHEITVGDSIQMDVTIRNDGTRRLDNIRIATDNPLNWRSIIEPDLIRSLDPEKEQIVHMTFIPPDDVGVGAQEVKIKTEALADNRRVQTEDKTVRIQVQAKTPILWTAVLIMLLIGLVLGIVIFGIKISRR
ncbi:MAG: hypothetical protein JXB48_19890 [Candidatus Latescibacteria bacterium]|nr:hypothetical protein [Candidatus Latescibacterota bacterium]